MFEKWIVFSVHFLLMGLNIFFLLKNPLGYLILGIAALISIILFASGLIKDRKKKINIRSWEHSWD
ncbi:MAG: hypothetical protein ACLFTQ_02775 [Candidatus Aenigmatarchaeota archaeon]